MDLETINWKNLGNWSKYKGKKIFVARYGNGPVKLLCLHAFPTSSFDFSRIVPFLSEHFEIILFDYPGYGFSDKPSNHIYSLFDFAQVAESVIQYFGLSEINILAHDIGNSVALELLRRSSLKIPALMLLNGSVWSIPFQSRGMLVSQRLSLNPLTGPWASRLFLFNKWTLGFFFKRIFYAPLSTAELDTFWSVVSYNRGYRNYHLLMNYMRERWSTQEIWLNALQVHPAKLGAIWGMNDPIATPEVLRIIEQYRPDTISLRLNKTGHYPHWERPIESARAVLNFFMG